MPTITTPEITAQQAQKLAQGFGLRYGLKDEQGQPRDATAAEVGKYALDWLRYEAINALRQKAAADAEAGVGDI